MDTAYTPAMIRFLKAKYQSYSARELTNIFNEYFGENRTVSAIKTVLATRGILLDEETRRQRNKCYSQEMIAFLKNGYQHYNYIELTKEFNEFFSQSRTPKAIQLVLMRYSPRQESGTIREKQRYHTRRNLKPLIGDLPEHLLKQLARLLLQEDFIAEGNRSKAVHGLAGNIKENAKVMLKTEEALKQWGFYETA